MIKMIKQRLACSFSSVSVLDISGYLYTWGGNNVGQLGDGTTTNSLIPKQIGTKKWNAIAVGYTHTAAIDTDGYLYTWGLNNVGQLGDGTTTKSLIPKQIGTKKWNAVDCGGDTTAAIDTDGYLYTWGANGVGQLGDGTTTKSLIPKQIKFVGLPSKLMYLFKNEANAYTVSNGTITFLGEITTENAASLFETNGLASITKEDCLTIAQSIKKAHILKMSV